MAQPKPAALAALDAFRRDGSIDLGPVRVDRDGRVGHVTIQHHAFLNSEDDASTAALETAVDLVLLDDAHRRRRAARRARDASEVRRPAHPRLRHQPDAALPREDLARRVHARARARRRLQALSRPRPGRLRRRGRARTRREKPWIAAVETFAIGGACQWLLVMDRVLAEAGSYFNLPARKEGIIPGCANLRLPRFVGERLARQAIFFNRDVPGRHAGGPADRRRGRRPGRDGRGDRARGDGAHELRDDERAREPPAAAASRRSRSRTSAAT